MIFYRLIILSLLASSLPIMAATNAKDLCHNYKKPDFFKKMLLKSQNRLNFRNKGGLLNGGVCWWHSRFTRNALYLAVFDNSLPRPTEQEAKHIIHQIRKGRKIVIIPGFSNLADFSYAYNNLIQHELEKWQIKDGFINQQWIIGLWGSTQTSAKKLAKKMNSMYNYIHNQHKIAYQKIQITGIDAHAWLVVNMQKNTNGYKLTIIDSNSLYIRHLNYTFGDRSLYDPWYGNILPYTGRKAELKRLEKVVHKFCKTYKFSR